MALPGRFPVNRYNALEEIQKVLGFSQIEWQAFFRIIRKANDGYLEFSRGGLNVQFALWSEDEKKVSLNIELQKNKTEKSATYEYSLTELEAFSKRKQLKVSSFRDR
jgi:hypothetical protein